MSNEIFFRAFEKEDVHLIHELRKRDELENLIGGNKRFVSFSREEKWVEDIIYNDSRTAIYLAVCLKETNEMVGYTSISDLDHVNKSCFWSGIKIHPNFHGRGLGKKVAQLALTYIFEELNMERCIGMCIEEHIVAKRMMEKVGFQVEGLQRHSVYKNGKYQNQFLLSILRSDFDNLKQK
ncbi:MAG: GNAT family N-acetyltransferase [Flavobacteriales bacterium]